MTLLHPDGLDSFRKAPSNPTPAATARILIDSGASEGDPVIEAATLADIQGNPTGEANTIASVGTGTVSLVEGKSGTELQVRSVASLNAALAVALDAGNKRVTFDLAIGTGSGQVAAGDHTHDAAYAALGHDHAGAYSALGHDHAGVYAAAVHGHAGYIAATDVNYANLAANGNVGPGANQVADGAHTHTPAEAGLGNVANLKVKLDATAAPGVTDDTAAGYAVGSEWINVTGDKAYKCVDASAGAAVWIETTQSAAGTSPGGSSAQVQFNDGGAFGGDPGLTYDKTTDILTVAGAVKSNTVSERTADTGVTVDGVLIKDGAIEADGLTESTTDAGVTIEDVLIKDGLTDGRDVEADGAKLDKMEIDTSNYSVTFFAGSAAFVESGAPGVFCTQGTPTFPNRLGDDTNVIQATGYDGTHVSGAEWRAADSGYPAGAADYCGIIGGYDCLNNQIGGWIAGSNHSVLLYNADGHAFIGGGSNNLISGARSAILGSTGCAITGTSGYSAVAAGRDSLIDDSSYCLVVGQDNFVYGSSANLVVGYSLEVKPGHNRSVVLGADAESPNSDSFTRGRVSMATVNDCRAMSMLFSKTTTNASLTAMDTSVDTFVAGKVYAGYVRARVVGLRDGGANGENDGTFAQVAYEGETSFLWNETDNTGNFDGGSDGTDPYFNLTLVGTDKIGGTGTCRLTLNLGRLKPRVTGVADTTIRWAAELQIISTAADDD